MGCVIFLRVCKEKFCRLGRGYLTVVERRVRGRGGVFWEGWEGKMFRGFFFRGGYLDLVI